MVIVHRTVIVIKVIKVIKARRVIIIVGPWVNLPGNWINGLTSLITL